MGRFTSRVRPAWLRVLTLVTSLSQVLVTIPIAHADAAQKQDQAPPVEESRTPSAAQPVPSTPTFSTPPTDAELGRARVFDEPLVPIGRGTAPEENQALADALMAYFRAGGGEDLSPFEGFLRAHPETPWRGGLLTNLGIVYRRTGYFSKALDAWEAAWLASKVAQDAKTNAIADRALAELAELNSRLGRADRVESLLAEIGARDVHGSAGERVSQAREGLAKMRETPGEAFRCGPMALDRIMAYGNAIYRPDRRITEAHSTQLGTSLLQVQKLSQTAGLNFQMAFRPVSASPSIPAVVHWKAGHFAALVAERDGKYLIQDPTFGNELWVSRKALDDEASGYAVIRSGPLPSGWRPVTETEGGGVWGKGFTNSNNNQCQTCQDLSHGGSTGGCGKASCPMAAYRIHSMLVALNLTDEPVRYSPPVGDAVAFAVSYHQREVFQPQVPVYGNLGPKWTYDWLSFIEDDPSNHNTPPNVYRRGGGQETYTSYDTPTQTYAIHSRSRAILVWAPQPLNGMPVRYERRLPDGSLEVYAQSDGAPSVPRRIYLTSWSDPQGNTTRLTYNGLKLVSVTDAIGQVTTISYELPADTLKITKVTDPFGRFATFQYNGQGQLQRITDVIGITSDFVYGTSDFITSLTTPYGTTRFKTGTGVDQMRWIEATDPMSAVERVEFRHNAPGISPSDPTNIVPAAPPGGISTFNEYLQARNTFFWDKRASAEDPSHHFYTKAVITHWLHDLDTTVASGIVESQKQPLENRVWYSYPNQPMPAYAGNFTASPAAVARVLDDGSTQVYRYEYNSIGKTTKRIDQLGRETRYTYASNGTDVTEVRQVNGAGTDLVESYTYDTQHRPLTFTDRSGQTWTMTYNGRAQISTVTTPARAGITEDRMTTYNYDPDGRLLSVTGPLAGNSLSLTYDGYGRVRTSTDPDGYVLTYDYDALDRVTKVTFPDGTYQETRYKHLDPEARRDRLGRWTHFFYDALRRPVATRDPAGRTFTQQWCTCGSLDKVIDADNNATSWERDVQGRMTREVRADNSTWEYTYEATTSRLKQLKDAKNQVTAYEYFLDGKTKRITHLNAQIPTADVSFTYDPVYGRPTTMTDGTGTTTYTYNDVTTPPVLGTGRVATIDGPLANDAVTYSSYDEVGRVRSGAVAGVGSTFSYDALGRLIAEGGALGDFQYTYDSVTSRLLSVTYPNGQMTQHTYFPNNGDHRIQELKHLDTAGAVLSKYNYAYDAQARMQTLAQQVGVAAPKSYEFGYDSADELTAATLKTTDPTPVLLKRYGYAYDGVGNRTSEQVDDLVQSATFNNRNQLVSRQPGGALLFRGTVNEPATVAVQGKPAQVMADNRFEGSTQIDPGTNTVSVTATDPSGNVRTNTYQVSQAGGSTASYVYDANGNLTSDGTRTFEWDADDRLLAINQGSLRSEFTYDGRSHRVRIVERSSGSVTSDRRFIWCDDQICGELDSTGSTLARRLYGRGMQEGGVNYFYTRDSLGSIRELTDSSGAVRARYDYDPYGRMTKTQGDKDSLFGFTGQYVHAASGLGLTLYRAYSSDQGRWLSQDPLGMTGGTNLYAYVNDQPNGGVDPLGLVAWLHCEHLTSQQGGGGLQGAIVYLTASFHCYIEVECPGEYHVTMELYGPSCGNPRGCPWMNLPSATRNSNSWWSPINPPGCNRKSSESPCPSKNCAFEDELINQFNQNQPPPLYSGTGPNSNTFAATIIKKAGGTTVWPTNAYGNNYCPKD